MKKMSGLTLKFIMGIMLIGVCITTAVVAVGVRLYQVSIKRQYNTMAYQTARTATGYFDLEDLKAYADLTYRYNTGDASEEEIASVTGSRAYRETEALIQDLRRNMGANDIYACVCDTDLLEDYDPEAFERREWNPLYYIVDSYHEEDARMAFGDKSPILPDYRQAILRSCETGVQTDDYLISEGQFGYNTTAVYPVVYEGRTIALVCVEIPMAALHADVGIFIRQAALAAAVIAFLMLLAGTWYLIRKLIRPIRLVASEAEHFVRNKNEISKTLGTIKTHDEIQILSESLLKMEIGINAYIEDLKVVTAEKERIGAELNVAAQIQADMLPSIFPPFPDRKEFDIYATMTPAKEVGGDFYDLFLVDRDHLALVMADVSGKGVPAALFMVIAKTLIKNRVQMGDSPAQALANVNEQLCEGNEAELFVTVWLAVIELSTGKGVAANAGHEHPAVKRADGNFELVVYRHSPAVAVMEGIPFREHEFALGPGDSLYVYTDGVPEATNAREEMFGTDRMLEALDREAQASPEKLLHTVKEEIDAFVDGAPQFDDVTMLCLRYFGEEAAADA